MCGRTAHALDHLVVDCVVLREVFNKVKVNKVLSCLCSDHRFRAVWLEFCQLSIAKICLERLDVIHLTTKDGLEPPEANKVNLIEVLESQRHAKQLPPKDHVQVQSDARSTVPEGPADNLSDQLKP